MRPTYHGPSSLKLGALRNLCFFIYLAFFAQSDEQNNRHTGESKHLHGKDAKSPCWLVTETEGQASYCHKEGTHKIQVPYVSVNKEL